MEFKIYKYLAEANPYSLFPDNMTARILEEDWNQFLSDYPAYRDGRANFFVKIECNNKEELTDFVIYCKLGVLPSTQLYEKEGSGLVWLASEIMPLNDCTTNKRSIVNMTIVDASEIPTADYLVLKLKEDEVDTWSVLDFVNAETHLRKNLKLCNGQQRVFFNRVSNEAVVATIEQVEPKPKDNKQPFWITSETQIKIEGKPADPQQVIDFSMIGGQKKVIDELRRLIQLPMNYPEYFSKFGINPPKGVLLYGPPGNGKTMIARAVAQSFGAAFIEIDLSDALQKYKGVGEYNLGKKFEEAERKKNAVIFIDEIDSIASVREIDNANHEISLVGKLLSLMDGIKSSHRVFVIGATNRLYAIDPALRRPGRFDKDIEVPQPDCDARYDILCKYVHLDHKGVFAPDVDDVFLKKLAADLVDYSGADIKALYTETAMSAIQKHLVFNEKGKALMDAEADTILITCDDFYEAEKVVKTTKQRASESKQIKTQ